MAAEIYALANGETINSNSIIKADGTQIKAPRLVKELRGLEQATRKGNKAGFEFARHIGNIFANGGEVLTSEGVFETQHDFAKATGVTDSTVSMMLSALAAVDKYGVDTDKTSVNKMYLISTLTTEQAGALIRGFFPDTLEDVPTKAQIIAGTAYDEETVRAKLKEISEDKTKSIRVIKKALSDWEKYAHGDVQDEQDEQDEQDDEVEICSFDYDGAHYEIPANVMAQYKVS